MLKTLRINSLRLLLVTLLYCGIFSAAQAQVPIQQGEDKASKGTLWIYRWDNTYSTNLVTGADAEKRTTVNSIFWVTTRFNSQVVLQSLLGFSQILDPRVEANLINPEFRLFYWFKNNAKGWSVSISPTVALPLSQRSRDESLYFTAGGAARLRYLDLDKAGHGWAFIYDIALNRNVHQYQTSVQGDPNEQWSLGHFGYLQYTFVNEIGLAGWVGYSSSWNYYNLLTSAYEVAQEVSYPVSNTISLAVNHRFGGDFLSPNGQDYQFGVFDNRDSRISFRVSISF